MIKPIAIGIPIVYFVVLVLTRPGTPWKSRGTYFVALSFGVFLVLAPWSTIVYNKTGEIIALTNGQLTYNSSRAGITFATEADGDREKLHIPNRVKKLLKTITDKYNKQASPYYAASRLWVDAIIDPLDTRKINSLKTIGLK